MKYNPHILVRAVQGAAEYLYFTENSKLEEDSFSRVVHNYLVRCFGEDRTHEKSYSPEEWKSINFKDDNVIKSNNRIIDHIVTQKNSNKISIAIELKFLFGSHSSEYELTGRQTAVGQTIVQDVFRLMSLKDSLGRGAKRYILVIGTRNSFETVWRSYNSLIEQVLPMEKGFLWSRSYPKKKMKFIESKDQLPLHHRLRKGYGIQWYQKMLSHFQNGENDLPKEFYSKLIASNLEDANEDSPITFDARVWELRSDNKFRKK